MGFSVISGQSCGYPLVPYRDTNIPCDLGWCFESIIFYSVTWVASVIRASEMPPPPPVHVCHSSYSQYFVPWTGIPANKMASCDCLIYAQKDTACTRKLLYRISSNGSRGRLFLFSHQKGAIIRGRFQILLTRIRIRNILFCFPIKSKNYHIK